MVVPARIVFSDLGDTLVEIKPELREDSAREICTLTGHFVSATDLQEAEREEWLARPPADFLWVRTEEDEHKYWEDFFYPNVLQRLDITSYPPQLIQLLAVIRMDPASFVPFPEVESALDELEYAGIELGIISNSFPSAENILKHLNLGHRFRYIILSHQYGCAKPDPKIYNQALRCANVQPEEAVFVDDRPNFVAGAEKLKMRAILINRNGYSDGWQGERIGNLQELLIRVRFVTHRLDFHCREP